MRRPSLDFKMIDVPVGSVLSFKEQKDVTCEVVNLNPARVRFDGEVVSLTKAAQKAGGFDYDVRGPLYWKYEGEFLTERRLRFEKLSNETLVKGKAKIEGKPLKVIAGKPDSALVVGPIALPCVVLENEERVFTQRVMFKVLGASRGGSHAAEHGDAESDYEDGAEGGAKSGLKSGIQSGTEDGAEDDGNGNQLPRFANQKWLHSYLSVELKHTLRNPIEFQMEGKVAFGYPAEFLVGICNAILDADQAGKTTIRQSQIVERAMILIQGFAHVGIIALVDEATGYQQEREKRALATILEEFISKDFQPWTKTFPYEFYREIYRLKKWPPPDGSKRPSVIGKYTNNLVYERLAPGVLEELQRINPVDPQTGTRHDFHHQWFTPDRGHPELKEHISIVTALMRAADEWHQFVKFLDRALPKYE